MVHLYRYAETANKEAIREAGNCMTTVGKHLMVVGVGVLVAVGLHKLCQRYLYDKIEKWRNSKD